MRLRKESESRIFSEEYLSSFTLLHRGELAARVYIVFERAHRGVNTTRTKRVQQTGVLVTRLFCR